MLFDVHFALCCIIICRRVREQKRRKTKTMQKLFNFPYERSVRLWSTCVRYQQRMWCVHISIWRMSIICSTLRTRAPPFEFNVCNTESILIARHSKWTNSTSPIFSWCISWSIDFDMCIKCNYRSLCFYTGLCSAYIMKNEMNANRSTFGSVWLKLLHRSLYSLLAPSNDTAFHSQRDSAMTDYRHTHPQW